MAQALAKKAPALAKAKPVKGKAVAKGKAKTAPKDPKWVAEGAIVEFTGYAQKNEEPVFEPGDRAVIVKIGKKDDQTTLTIIRESQHAAYVETPEDEESYEGDEVFLTEVKKAEKLPVDPYVFDLVHIGRVDEILGEAEGDPLAAYNTLEGNVREAFFYQGAMIGELYRGRKFKEYGDYEDETEGDKVKHGSGWNKFAREQLEMEGRKAHAAMQVYQRFSAIPDFDPTTISNIGWVKLQIMANSITPENVTELIEKAETTATDEFREVIRTDYVADRESQGTARQAAPKVKKTTFTFKLYEDAGEGVAMVLAEAQKDFGFDNLDQVLERIVMQWASDNLSEAAFGKAMKRRKAKAVELKKLGHDTTELVKATADLEAALTPAEDAAVEETED